MESLTDSFLLKNGNADRDNTVRMITARLMTRGARARRVRSDARAPDGTPEEPAPPRMDEETDDPLDHTIIAGVGRAAGDGSAEGDASPRLGTDVGDRRPIARLYGPGTAGAVRGGNPICVAEAIS